MRKEGSDLPHHNAVAKPLPLRPLALAVYNIAIAGYVLGIKAYGIFNAKAGKWAAGRKDWRSHYAAVLQPGEQRVWVHCASVGEFEQAKPLVAAIRQEYPAYRIVLTFFSPSGYEACRHTTLADHVFYLPHDTRHNAAIFLDLVQPKMAFFVKYEFWYHYLAALHRRHIPALLVSGAFRPEQPFFKPYGALFRDMLSCFTAFYLQDDESAGALRSIGFHDNITISGDTRYDRVSVIAGRTAPMPSIEGFKGDCKLLIAGSTWPADEDIIKDCLSVLPAHYKVILAPHEVDEAHIARIMQLFGTQAILYSALSAAQTGSHHRILVIDNIGMLSRLFAYGHIAFIGGGFSKGGIHNILEPAVFGLPVIFGPEYEKFVEAKKLRGEHLVFPISDAACCREILGRLINEQAFYQRISTGLLAFMRAHTGATRIIMAALQEHHWLS